MSTEAEVKPIALILTDEEAVAVQAVLRDCAGHRWERRQEEIDACTQVQWRIRRQFMDRNGIAYPDKFKEREPDGYPHQFADQVARITEMERELGLRDSDGRVIGNIMQIPDVIQDRIDALVASRDTEPIPNGIQAEVSAMLREWGSKRSWCVQKAHQFSRWQADHFWLAVGSAFAFAATVGVVAYLVAMATIQ